MKDTCEWNPEQNRAAYEGEHQVPADLIVGASKGNWRLCRSCADLPRFKRYGRRKEIVDMNWRPVSEKPKAEAKPGVYWKEARVLLWVDDPEHAAKGWVTGRYVEQQNGDGSFVPDSMSGWIKVTHWMAIEPPKAK